MLIETQDGGAVIRWEAVRYIYLGYENQSEIWAKFGDDAINPYGDVLVLGEYSSPEVAKAVMDELARFACGCEMIDKSMYSIIEQNDPAGVTQTVIDSYMSQVCFRMPKE